MKHAHGALVICICAITVFRCFYFDWYKTPEKWDEQTNVAVISQTKNHNTIPVLWYNNKPFFEKPPIWFLVGTIIPTHRSIPLFVYLRFSSAVFGSMLLLIVWFVAYRLWGMPAGILAWIMLLSTHHLFASDLTDFFSTHSLQSADGDALFILLIVCASVFCIRIHASKTAAVLTGIFTGLALLTKSPIGCIPLVCVTLTEIGNGKKLFISRNVLIAWVISILLFGVWFIPMMIFFGTPFLNEYLMYHILKRAIIPLELHTGSMFFYISLLFSKQVFLYMELYLLCGFLIVRSEKLKQNSALTYVFIVSLCFLIVPSLIQTKLSWYIFPFYPFAALTISGAVTQLISFSSFSGKRI